MMILSLILAFSVVTTLRGELDRFGQLQRRPGHERRVLAVDGRHQRALAVHAAGVSRAHRRRQPHARHGGRRRPYGELCA